MKRGGYLPRIIVMSLSFGHACLCIGSSSLSVSLSFNRSAAPFFFLIAADRLKDRETDSEDTTNHTFGLTARSLRLFSRAVSHCLCLCLCIGRRRDFFFFTRRPIQRQAKQRECWKKRPCTRLTRDFDSRVDGQPSCPFNLLSSPHSFGVLISPVFDSNN